MHTFQPYPTDLFELNPFSKLAKDWCLVTTGTKDKVNTMTAAWGGFGVIWGKNVVTIYIRQSRYTKELIDQNETFSLTFFDGKKNELKYLGAVSGRDEDKFAGSRFHAEFSKDTPYVDEGNLVFLCKKLSATPLLPEQFLDSSIASFYKDGDYHVMYVGEILEILAR